MSSVSGGDTRSFSLPSARRPRDVRRLVGASFALLIAAATGLGATYIALENGAGFGAVRSGAWTAWPRNGAPDADPYSRAIVARSGELPLGLGEGLAFTATRDSADQPLVGRCTYRIVGRVPQTRAWTITAETRDGSLMPNAAERYGFTSSEVVRDGAGRFAIVLSRSASPGDWLPLGVDGRFEVVLRLYDTPVSATAAALDPALLPRIEREACQ